jgi:hypothetical protein
MDTTIQDENTVFSFHFTYQNARHDNPGHNLNNTAVKTCNLVLYHYTAI